jgi:predicted lipoprotein with Yx(FWY)xxD motif
MLVAAGTMAMAASVPAAKISHPVVRLAIIKVDGKKMKVFETSQGHTLYYFTKDHPKKLACVGKCQSIWPPYRVKSIPRISGVKGHFSLFRGQLEYQGHPLYTYSGDKGPGESHGEGLLHEWYVATPTLGVAGGGGGSGGGGW